MLAFLSGLLLVSLAAAGDESIVVRLVVPDRPLLTGDAFIVRAEIANSGKVVESLDCPLWFGRGIYIEYSYPGSKIIGISSSSQAMIGCPMIKLAAGEKWTQVGLVWLDRERLPVLADADDYRMRVRIRHHDKNIVSQWLNISVKARPPDRWRFLRNDRTVEVLGLALEGSLERSLEALSGKLTVPAIEATLKQLQKDEAGSSLAEIAERMCTFEKLRLKTGDPPRAADWEALIDTKDENLREHLLRRIAGFANSPPNRELLEFALTHTKFRDKSWGQREVQLEGMRPIRK